MKPIKVPKDYNYIEAFLTFDCNMNCPYCINKYGETSVHLRPMTASQWVDGLLRIKSDIPITLGGGEPTMHPGFYEIVDALPNGKVDLLTNGTFDVEEFMDEISPEKFKRKAKYASIRISLHNTTNVELLIDNAIALKKNNYSIGIWAVDHPSMTSRILRVHEICKKNGLDFRVKEFLGYYRGKVYGRYKYPKAIGQTLTSNVMCKTSELLISPDGLIFMCHADLYLHRDPIGDILEEVEFKGFQECSFYGNCNPCDVKLKYNRFQVHGHCSVEIKKSI